jgi:hypothetical protein
MQWLGVYNLIEMDLVPHLNFPDESDIDYNATYAKILKQRCTRDWAYTLGGMLLLLLSNTFYNMSTVFPPEVEVDRAKPRKFVKPAGDSSRHSLGHHASPAESSPRSPNVLFLLNYLADS